MNVSSWLIDTVTIQSMTGIGVSGDPAYGSQTSVKCRLENETKIVFDKSGEEKLAKNKLVTTTAIAVDDRIWLPGDSLSGGSRRILSVSSAKNKDGTFTLYEVWL